MLSGTSRRGRGGETASSGSCQGRRWSWPWVEMAVHEVRRDAWGGTSPSACSRSGAASDYVKALGVSTDLGRAPVLVAGEGPRRGRRRVNGAPFNNGLVASTRSRPG